MNAEFKAGGNLFKLWKVLDPIGEFVANTASHLPPKLLKLILDAAEDDPTATAFSIESNGELLADGFVFRANPYIVVHLTPCLGEENCKDDMPVVVVFKSKNTLSPLYSVGRVGRWKHKIATVLAALTTFSSLRAMEHMGE